MDIYQEQVDDLEDVEDFEDNDEDNDDTKDKNIKNNNKNNNINNNDKKDKNNINKNNNDKNNDNKDNKEQKPKVSVTKDELILYIKEWIKIDNEIIQLKNQVKEKTNKKKELTESLVNVMKSNSIDCFDINGGALIYKQKKIRRCISGKFLLSQLEEYYKEQPELAKEITKKVLDNRIEVVKDEIKRKIDK
jgi:hypothetical protein